MVYGLGRRRGEVIRGFGTKRRGTGWEERGREITVGGQDRQWVKRLLLLSLVGFALVWQNHFQFSFSFRSLLCTCVLMCSLLGQLLSFTDQLFQGQSCANLKWNPPPILDSCKILPVIVVVVVFVVEVH